jgi:hypothetical protein
MVLIGFYAVVGFTGKTLFGGGKKEEAAPVSLWTRASGVSPSV